MTNTTELIDEVSELAIDLDASRGGECWDKDIEEIITLIKDHYREALVEGIETRLQFRSCPCYQEVTKTINEVMK